AKCALIAFFAVSVCALVVGVANCTESRRFIRPLASEQRSSRISRAVYIFDPAKHPEFFPPSRDARNAMLPNESLAGERNENLDAGRKVDLEGRAGLALVGRSHRQALAVQYFGLHPGDLGVS